jgi:hypothetical protein
VREPHNWVWEPTPEVKPSIEFEHPDVRMYSWGTFKVWITDPAVGPCLYNIEEATFTTPPETRTFEEVLDLCYDTAHLTADW